jgi:hypothetical protein
MTDAPVLLDAQLADLQRELAHLAAQVQTAHQMFVYWRERALKAEEALERLRKTQR